MNKPGLVTISMNELQRIKVIESVVEGRLTGVRAAERLGLTERQVSRLKRRFEAAGAAGLVSAKRGKPSLREAFTNATAFCWPRRRCANGRNTHPNARCWCQGTLLHGCL
ncbi:helix-turn-helix domain-containing protein [Burkholderia gladioli]|uniref:helix-turn-helix domain-containing protein n=1 Tax=Burkholderia gladioli TaxID=28095 RepID=UPI001FC7E655|nr:helix-turn-helix domain-containing protein [Burkholderia gladioli]